MTGKRKRTPMGPALGNALAAIDGQIFRTTPPTHELVHHARPDLAIAAGDGGTLTISLPIDSRRPIAVLDDAEEAVSEARRD